MSQLHGLTLEQVHEHLKRVVEHLPSELRGRGVVTGTKASACTLTLDGAEARIIRSYGRERPTLRVEPETTIIHAKTRWWPLRKDNTFNYEKVAEYMVSLRAAYQERQTRIDAGESLAESRVSVLQKTFRSDAKLNALNLEILASPVHRTESGDVDVEISCANDDAVAAKFEFDGTKFFGSIDVLSGVTIEQLTAIMVVLRADQLNILDMITLADDSILGPIINRLTETLEQSSAGPAV